MKNVTTMFRNELNNDNRRYIKSCSINLSNGVVLSIDNKSIWGNQFKVEDAVSSQDQFDIGSVIVGKFTLVLNNIYEDYSVYDFADAVITDVIVGLNLSDGSVEYVDKGVFTVDKPTYNGSTITLECLDNMSKFDKDYSLSTLVYPATLNAIVQDACSCCGVSLAADSATFENGDFVVPERPSSANLTFRQVLLWVGQISCHWCRCNTNGQLSLGWYNTDLLEKMNGYDGGSFEPWTEGDTLDGGTFSPWTTGNTIDGGTFAEMQGYHHIYYLSSKNISTDDVVITGIKVVEKAVESSDSEDVAYQYGTDGYVLSIEGNEFIQNGAGAQVAEYLGKKLNGLRFRPLTVSCLSDPSIEAGDVAYVTDRKGRSYATLITSTTFKSGSYQTVSCDAETPKKNSATRYSENTRIYQELRKRLARNKSEWEKAVQDLSDRLSASSGAYTTIESAAGGGSIFYLHNKPTLAESDMVWKMTAEAWGVSTDGGKTWNGGMTVDGDTITRILTAIGVNATWINTGALVVKDDAGNTIFSVDMDTKKVIISGDYVQIGGKALGTAISDAVTESKEYSDSKLADYANTVTKDLDNLQAQIDGQIETYYEDYEPSLQNLPASEWTTTAEREKHIGDLFYWKSTGYAYRFLLDGSTWKWQIVQDTDITKALAAAENAQDTADGKRRTFVSTPAPPYDIGDIWMQGSSGDILTCSTARAEGSSYVSSDWSKLNKYTDDTVANEALAEAKAAKALSIIMDNEYQGIPTDSEGNYTTFPTVQTAVVAYMGHENVSASCTYTTTPSAGVKGSWDATTRTYTVTALTTDTGYVDITATYLNIFTATKRFNVAKVRDGAEGATGKPGQDGKDGENGKDGSDGKDGAGISSVTVTYGTSASPSTIPSSWSTSIPTVPEGQYLWTRTVTDYTDSSMEDTVAYTYAKQGAAGAQGTAGTSVKVSSIQYQAGTSATTAPTGTWSSSVVSVSEGQYLWTKTTFSDGSVAYGVARQGENGADGKDGENGKDGSNGKDGADGRVFILEPSTLVIKQGADNAFSPTTVTFSAYYRDGQSAARTAYAGRFVIQETTDSVNYVTKYTSSANESTKVYTPSSTSVKNIRCTLYAAGGTTVALDMQGVAIVKDIDNLTHEEIFNLFTNNGAVKGFTQVNGQIYISFTYARGGELALGGANDGNGVQEIYDASGKLIGSISNEGLRFYYSYTDDDNYICLKMSKSGIYYEEYEDGNGVLDARADMISANPDDRGMDASFNILSYNKIANSDWITTSFTGYFANYSSGVSPRYRKKIDEVEIEGVATVEGATSLEASTAAYTMFTLPEGYRPSRTKYQICQGSGVNKWLLTVNTSGVVGISRYGSSANSAIPQGAWLPFYFRFSID